MDEHTTLASRPPRDPSDDRPDPDALLARLAHGDASDRRGRLKIFFGYSAGVGKTYAMLSAARELEMKRGDVLVGYVEPHGRPETEALLLGLEILPYKVVEYRGVTLREFDLDAALARAPKLLLVDELAHTNADGCRHPKRWQDVLELLDAGIDVYTTVNVQHLESLNDVVGTITGVVVRETVPDSIFDLATDVELVDLPPHELLERFSEGKVYLPDQAKRAADRFFRKESLVALRELALRRTAEHVNRQVELGRRGVATKPIWATRDRLMVAVGPNPASARLIRTTRRMATELRAPWIAVAIERPSAGALSAAARGSLDANLRLAESLGGEIVVVHNEDVARALVDVARDRGVTRLVVGKTSEPRWRTWISPSIVDRVVRLSGDMDVLVIRGDAATGTIPSQLGADPVGGRRSDDRSAAPAAWVVTTLAASLAVGIGLRSIGASETNIIMAFLLGVVVVAHRAGRLPAAVFSVASVLTFNFFFTEPRFTFAVHDLQYVVTFGVMLLVGLFVGGLVGRIKLQAKAAEDRADANDVLHRVASRLASTTGRSHIAVETLSMLDELLKVDAVVYPRDAEGLGSGFGDAALLANVAERAVANWSMEHGVQAGLGTSTLPNAAAWYIPLAPRAGEVLGVLGVRPRSGEFDFARRRLLASIAVIVAHAAEREDLAERARSASVSAESERLRSDLLATVSHDLRTPLATIGGAAATVLGRAGPALDVRDRSLLEDIVGESDRLTRLVENLLRLGGLDGGRARIDADWYPVDELVDAALRQCPPSAEARSVEVDVDPPGLLVHADAALATQLLFNLIDNAIRHGAGAQVRLRVRASGRATRLEVSDRGPGFGSHPPALLERFRRGENRSGRGLGLGLAICRAITEAHGGTIALHNRDGGGAETTVTLPYPEGLDPPRHLDDSAAAERHP